MTAGNGASGHPSRHAFVVACLMFAAVMAVLVFALKFDAGLSAIAAFVCAVYTFFMQRMSYAVLNADLEDDAVFARQVRRAHRMPYAGLVLCVVLSLPIGMAVGASHISWSDLDQLQSVMTVDRQIAAYESHYGEGAYERARLKKGMGESEFADYMFGIDRFYALRAVTNPLALGGEAFWGALACSLLLVGALEVPATNIGLDPIMEDIRTRGGTPGKPESAGGDGNDGGSGDGGGNGGNGGDGGRKRHGKHERRNITGEDDSGLDFTAMPEDTHAMVRKSLGTPGVHVTEGMRMETTGSPRADAIAAMLQGIALWHVRKGLVMLLVFGGWAVLAMVGVFFNLVT
ncbi:hypothetical protein [Bifidobacterium saguinibicoloris]|uniref:hypothetical protein n=1 Tax=Bifidobacterium saguinibicoloris TaxID=2834433 RepID=UPI001C5943DA|nr:hypothetical protein [Bifidobacterium saguinibicoloris]MBW3081451.1 hypothetical protein [Bifidobacterium saguinibicoloris]